MRLRQVSYFKITRRFFKARNRFSKKVPILEYSTKQQRNERKRNRKDDLTLGKNENNRRQIEPIKVDLCQIKQYYGAIADRN